MYKEYSPSPLLAPYIDKYWEFKGEVLNEMHFNILPDGCTDFIFTLGEVANACGETLVMHPYRSYFVGAMTKYSKLVADAGTINMLGIRFRAYGVCYFTQLPLQELTNMRVHTSDLDTIFNDSITDILCEKETIREKIDFLEKHLIKHLYHSPCEVDKSIVYAVNQINLHHGQQPIQALIDEVNLCQRHFERKFKCFTGFTPKEYSRIKQFQNAVELLRNSDFDNLLSVAVSAGYYDVSHLSREVKRMSGNTPVSFVSAPQPKDVTLTYVNS